MDAGPRVLQNIFFFKYVERRDGRRTSDGVASISAAHAARRLFISYLGLRDHRAQGVARREALRRRQDVRLDARRVTSVERARAPGAALDLVGDEQSAVGVAPLPQMF